MMDRRSWLWRRKSTEKSPGETDSSGGSISSHSERFSDEQASATHSSQSLEVTSKAVPIDEEVNDNAKSLTEKLSAAFMNISAKEALVKQHAKVAEEAVSGWEKAEKDVFALKQRLDAAVKKNAALEDRVGHLDGALKECVRQLRQAREEQEQKVHEAVTKKCHEWESSKGELERQLQDFKVQLQTPKCGTPASVDPYLQSKLEEVQRENSDLKLLLLSRAEELELRIIERDLSAQAAETASKQHLESIKKLAKLEAECRRLKAIAPKASSTNDQKFYAASSIFVESFTDSQSYSGEGLLAVETDMNKMNGLEMNECDTSRSDAWASAQITELDQLRNQKTFGRNIMAPSLEINLMDDFLEMERLAALPEKESGSGFNEAGPISNQTSTVENPVKAELETFICQIAELEAKLMMTEAEKLEVQMAFTESQKQLKALQNQLSDAKTKLADVQTQFTLADNSKQAAEEELKVTNMNRVATESRLRDAEIEIKTLMSKVTSSEQEVEKEQALSALQNQLRNSKTKLADMQTQLALADNLKQAAEEEVKVTNMKSRLRDAEIEIKTLMSKVTSSEQEVEKEQALSALQNQLRYAKTKLADMQTQLALADNLKQAAEEEVKVANMNREMVETRLRDAEIEIKTLMSKVTSLEEEVEKEQALSAKNMAMCKELEDEISKLKCESKLRHGAELQHVASYNEELKVQQDKELAFAASKLADCQKTIASLGQQLKALATLEDFLIDSDKPQELVDCGL